MCIQGYDLLMDKLPYNILRINLLAGSEYESNSNMSNHVNLKRRLIQITQMNRFNIAFDENNV